MFTGIVEELGEVVAVESLPDAARLTVRGPLVTEDAAHGDSIAVNGVCLTVVGLSAGTFVADVMLETLRRSSLAEAVPGAAVNLERAARVDARLGGHLVQGHVDGTGRMLAREQSEHWELVRLSLPADLGRYVVAKGSITVDGVSLTVVEVAPVEATEPWFTVSLVPATLASTTLGRRAVGDVVNLEVDVIGKYVERQLAGRNV